MIEIILILLALIPTIWGLAEILHKLRLKIISPREVPPTYVIMYLYGDMPRQQILYAAEKYFWQGKKYISNIILLNTFLNGEDFEECKKIAEHYGFIFCSDNEISNIIGQ
ncbi:MAG: hypothetical protein E7560_04870 [Ruminococcaceae bacterium]|nr:hypothetical protein [Oscillospiraceae bacterium]